MLKETKHYPLLLDYTSWQDGQIGSVGQFNRNGTDSENSRVLDIDPWGKETIVWQAQNNDVTSNADGGWNSSWINVDENYTYRFSTWVKRPNTGNGTFYFGCYASPTILNSSNLVANGNPYFHIAGGLTNDWVLVVAHVHPSGTPAGTLHPDSGIYNIFDRIGNINRQDYIMAAGTTLLKHRSYLFYSTDPSTIQQWVYPRLDKCDGTEPSIKELLAGHDSRNIEMVRSQGGTISKPMTIDNNATFTEISEVGVTDELIAWYPLTKDTNDYSGNGANLDLVSATTMSGGFQGKGSYIFANNQYVKTNTWPLSVNATVSVSAWGKMTATTPQMLFSFDSDSYYYGIDLYVYNSKFYWNTGDGTANPFKDINNNVVGIPTLNEIHHYVIVNDSVNNECRLYIDNVHVGTAQYRNTIQSANRKFVIGNYNIVDNYEWNGSISNVKIFDKALTPKEISIEYKLGTNTKTHINNNKTYIQGQFKEI